MEDSPKISRRPNFEQKNFNVPHFLERNAFKKFFIKFFLLILLIQI